VNMTSPVPTDESTVNAREIVVPDPDGGQHATAVAEVHAAVRHAVDATPVEGVALATAKLRPVTVMLWPAEVTPLAEVTNETVGAVETARWVSRLTNT
jgi:hypothetical protein